MSKEKQIDEMIEIVKPFVSGLACGDESGSCELTDCRSCKARNLAKAIIEKDYRKQSEGEWETILHNPRGEMLNAYSHICSECGFFYKNIRPNGYNFCPNCGAKMKGG